MTRDIIERLEACHGIHSGDPECCCLEAAAEIRWLRQRCQSHVRMLKVLVSYFENTDDANKKAGTP